MLAIILIILDTLSVLLHTLGSYLLICVYQNGCQETQQIYIINLAVCEAFIGLLSLLYTAVPTDVGIYVGSFIIFGFVTTIYLTMIYISIDRLLDVKLNIRYPLFWNEKKTKYLLIVTWLVNISISIVIIIIHGYAKMNISLSITMPIFITFDFFFTLLAFITYGYLFEKYRRTRVPPIHNTTQPKLSVFRVFRNSKFYVSALLIITFLSFTVVPDMIMFYLVLINGYISETVFTICKILFAISRLSDACIYIFMKPSVKCLLVEKLAIFQRINDIV